MTASLDGSVLADLTLADLVLAFMAVEALVLVILHRRTGRGIETVDLVGMLVPGLCLLLALRVALSGGGALWVALCLLAALPAHLLDLSRRWRR